MMEGNIGRAANGFEVCGRLQHGLRLSHEAKGERIYTGLLEVSRLSGTKDILPIMVPGCIFERVQSLAGAHLMLSGQLRSYNTKGRLSVNLFVQGAACAPESTLNRVHLTGTLCRDPVYRITPFGREICDMLLLADTSIYRRDIIPCIAWGTDAQMAAELRTGGRIQLSGRLQSREYDKLQKDGSYITRTVHEVSIYTIKIPEEDTER